MDCSPPGSSAHGILQARILEWLSISFSRGSSQPRDETHVSCVVRLILYHWNTRKALNINIQTCNIQMNKTCILWRYIHPWVRICMWGKSKGVEIGGNERQQSQRDAFQGLVGIIFIIWGIWFTQLCTHKNKNENNSSHPRLYPLSSWWPMSGRGKSRDGAPLCFRG